MKIYNPPRFQQNNHSEAIEFVDKNSFATLITVYNGEPYISQIPLVVQSIDQDLFLIGHMANQNPHAKVIGQSNATVIFHGSHTYITPSWYAENDVPTWNYSAVQMRGEVELIENAEGLIECLKILTAAVELKYPSGWDFFIPEDLQGAVLEKSIVGFKIKITELSFKQKLSQNRSDQDRRGILKGLSQRSDDQSRHVLTDMNRLYNDDGTFKN
jgi:transcriptional regulator